MPDDSKNGEVAATLTIRDASDMTKAGRRRIAAWLRSQAEFVVAEGDNFAPRFRGRYLYSDKGAV